MKVVWILARCLLLVLCGAYIGFVAAEKVIEPVVVVRQVPYPYEVYKEKKVYETVYPSPKVVHHYPAPEIETVIEYVPIPISPSPFKSKMELENWLNNYEPVARFWGGVTKFNKYDCEDEAVSMMVSAIEDGFILDTELVNKDRHMICKAQIPSENKIYFIDWETREITGSINMD